MFGVVTRSEVSPEATEEFDTLLAKLAQAIREERGGVASFACYRVSGVPNARVVIELSRTTLQVDNPSTTRNIPHEGLMPTWT